MRAIPLLFSLLKLVSYANSNATELTPSNPIFFYQISYHGQISYLLGTTHGGVSLSDLPNVVTSTLKDSKSLAVEHAVDRELALGYPQTYLEEAIKSLRFDGDALNSSERNALMRDWNVPSNLALKATSTDCPLITFGHQYLRTALDLEIQSVFLHSHQSSVISLDTPDQVKLAEKQSGLGPTGRCDVRKYLGMKDALIAAGDRARNRYLSGDPQLNSSPDMSTYNAIRNRNWIPKILQILDSGKIFIAVGVAHLWDEDGLLNLLSANGCSVDRVN